VVPPATGQKANTVSTNNVENAFSLYPNPVRQIANLQSFAKIEQDVTIRVVNLTGKEVFRKIVKENEVSKELSFNFENLITGVYFLTAQGNKDAQIIHQGKFLKK